MSSSATKAAQPADFAATLRARGLRATPQRLLIHHVVCSLDRHATAEHVFNEVAGELPGVSLPTVYATLELFEELGLVRRVLTAGGAVVFDSRTDVHYHAICRRCGRVEDIAAPVDVAPVLEAAGRKGFTGGNADLVVSGLCADCAAGSAT